LIIIDFLLKKTGKMDQFGRSPTLNMKKENSQVLDMPGYLTIDSDKDVKFTCMTCKDAIDVSNARECIGCEAPYCSDHGDMLINSKK